MSKEAGMPEKGKTRTMLLVTDAEGSIVAAAHAADSAERDVNIGISALPGQTIHRVAVPEALLELAGHHLAAAFAHTRVKPGTTELHFPEITIKNREHKEKAGGR
jgi:hypothetical protein